MDNLGLPLRQSPNFSAITCPNIDDKTTRNRPPGPRDVRAKIRTTACSQGPRRFSAGDRLLTKTTW
jgi:hypothetical protein